MSNVGELWGTTRPLGRGRLVVFASAPSQTSEAEEDLGTWHALKQTSKQTNSNKLQQKHQEAVTSSDALVTDSDALVTPSNKNTFHLKV